MRLLVYAHALGTDQRPSASFRLSVHAGWQVRVPGTVGSDGSPLLGTGFRFSVDPPVLRAVLPVFEGQGGGQDGTQGSGSEAAQGFPVAGMFWRGCVRTGREERVLPGAGMWHGAVGLLGLCVCLGMDARTGYCFLRVSMTSEYDE